MELPKSKWEFLTEGGKFACRLPFLYLSYLRSRPFHVSPLSVDMSITDSCNFQCKHCRGMDTSYQPKDEIDFDTVKKALNDMSKMHIPYLTLGGGEPLLRYDFILQILEYAGSLGIKVGMVTNGWLLNADKLIELAKAGLHRIAFSLDGADEETHDWVRKPGSFNNIMSGLDLCQDVKKQHNFRLHINTVVMHQNFKQLVTVAEIARKYNASVFYQPVGMPQVYPLQEQTINLHQGIEQFIIKAAELDDLGMEIKKLIAFKKRYGVIGSLNWQLSNIVDYYESLEVGKAKTKYKCYAGFNTIHIESDREISSCIFMPAVGSIKDIGIKEAWYTEGYDKQRKLIKQCTRPCELNCYYPISLPALAYEFLYLPLRRLFR